MDEFSESEPDRHHDPLKSMVSKNESRVQELGKRIGHPFRASALALEALTHRSSGAHHNERLEFLGDSVLNLTVAHWLFEQYPQFTEGDLSRIRSGLVNREALLHVAQQLHLGELLQLGEGELKSGGGSRPSILADAVEAVFGAVFCDGGLVAAEVVIRRMLTPLLATFDPATASKDAKTRLQEWLQARHRALPSYRLLETRGEAHDQTFRVECVVHEPVLRTEAEGKSRRHAEQLAAKRAIDLLPEGGE